MLIYQLFTLCARRNIKPVGCHGLLLRRDDGPFRGVLSGDQAFNLTFLFRWTFGAILNCLAPDSNVAYRLVVWMQEEPLPAIFLAAQISMNCQTTSLI